MEMTEIMVTLLGGGVIVQLLQTMLTLRQSKRQMDGAALGTEVTALETTIRILQENIENTTAYYQREIARLRQEITSLEERIRDLSGKRAEVPAGQ